MIYFGQAARAAGGEAHSTNKKHPDALVTDATINLIPFLCVFPPVRAAVNQFQLSGPNFVKDTDALEDFLNSRKHTRRLLSIIHYAMIKNNMKN